MATNSSYSQKVVKCRGRACAKCGCCRDWYWSPEGKTKSYKKRPDGTCTASDAYGRPGYGPGCGGCCLCILARFPFGNLCAPRGFLRGGLDNNIDALAGTDVGGRRRRNENARRADLALGGVASFGAGLADLTDGTFGARIALRRAHHDDGRLCECNDNQQ